MRRGLLLTLLAVPALAACGSSQTPTRAARPPQPQIPSSTAPRTTPSSVSTPAPPAPRRPVYFEGAAGGAAQRPGSLQLTADGTLAVEGVQWTSWGGPQATGTGNAVYHGCTPNCAQAPVHNALVSIRLAQIRVCGGRQFYSAVTLRLNSGQLLDREFLQRSWSPC